MEATQGGLQYGVVIPNERRFYGVGFMPDEALQDARSNGMDFSDGETTARLILRSAYPGDPSLFLRGPGDDPQIVPITAALAAAIRTQGGDTAHFSAPHTAPWGTPADAIRTRATRARTLAPIVLAREPTLKAIEGLEAELDSVTQAADTSPMGCLSVQTAAELVVIVGLTNAELLAARKRAAACLDDLQGQVREQEAILERLDTALEEASSARHAIHACCPQDSDLDGVKQAWRAVSGEPKGHGINLADALLAEARAKAGL